MFRISEFPALLKVDLYGVRKRAPLWHSRADNNMTEGQRESGKSSILTGTTLRVYRLLFREGRPLAAHDIQESLRLSSPSVAHYHITKLLRAGLVREEGNGYVVDKVVFENIIRFRRINVPFEASLVAFFGSSLLALLTVLKPLITTSSYFFSFVVILVAFIMFTYRMIRAMGRSL